jgi:hypothetical protein
LRRSWIPSPDPFRRWGFYVSWQLCNADLYSDFTGKRFAEMRPPTRGIVIWYKWGWPYKWSLNLQWLSLRDLSLWLDLVWINFWKVLWPPITIFMSKNDILNWFLR